MSKFLEQFRVLAAERLDHIGAAVLKLEARPSAHEPVADLARELHTLKGEARLVGLKGVSTVAHRIEDVFAYARARSFDVTAEAWDVMLRGCDLARAMILAAPDESTFTGAKSEFERDVDDLVAGRPLALAREPPDVASAPPSSAPPGTGAARRSLVISSARRPSAAAEVTRAPKFEAPRASIAPDDLELVRLRPKDIERLSALATPMRGLADGLSSALAALARDPNTPRELRGTLRGALERSRSLLWHVASLEDELRQVRMVPLLSVVDEVRRVLRDVCRATGKQAELEVTGAELSVERRVLLALREALLHLVRNAVDHGFESPEQRQRAGKPLAGRLRLELSESGGRAQIGVSDDGRGIQVESLRRVAGERGLTGSDSELIQVVFEAGVSTKTTTDEISGRGVGLSAVRDTLKKVRGAIHVETSLGKGTRFLLQVPIAVASSNHTIFSIDQMLYALPSWATDGLETVPSDADWITRGDEKIPVVHPPGPRTPGLERPALVVSLRDGLAAVPVDAVVHGAIEVLSGPTPGLLLGHPLLTGVVQLVSGQIVPVVDPLRLIELVCEQRLAQEAAEPERAPRQRIVVAEDSPITAAIVEETLTGFGYQVTLARDGREALDEIRRLRPALVLTDIEMPRMTGIELVRAIRADPELHDLPAIVLTSLGSEADRRAGLEAGADAYLIKGEFGVARLAETVSALLAHTEWA